MAKAKKERKQRHLWVQEEEKKIEESAEDSSSSSQPRESSLPEEAKESNGNKTTEDNNLPQSPSPPSLPEQDEKDHARPTKPRPLSFSLVMIGAMLRCCFLDLPILFLFFLYISAGLILDISREYLIPQAELQYFSAEKAERELTYYHRNCGPETQTANDTGPLIVQEDMTSSDALDMMLKHGLAVFPKLISNETANELRNFILHENSVSDELIYVIENKNRWSFPTRVDQHPSVTKALKEILNNQKLVESIEKIAGRNPAVIEFTAITSAYGATAQYWHQDVVPETNGAKYARNFIPSYSLFIPLQNTTAAMGATGICPGTHMCAAGPSSFCAQTGFQVSGKIDDNWPMGYGALLNQQTTHRGEAHTDPNGPARVVFILTFAPRPLQGKRVETRLIGQKGSYSMHWSHWGHTLADFQNPERRMAQPWRVLRSFGLYNPFGNEWGWDYITVASGRMSNDDTGFTYGDFDEFMEKGGFPFLPIFLQGGNYSELEGSSQVWVRFLMDTLSKIKDNSLLLHGVWLLTNLSIVLLGAFVFSTKVGTSTGRGLAKATVRIVFMHGLVLVGSRLAMHRLQKSPWAINIKSRRSFNLPTQLTLAPDLPATLPTEKDILIFDNMKSDYMYSYTHVLEVAHPGNLAWNDMIAPYSSGYQDLTLGMQDYLRSSLIRWAKIYGRSRILVKNSESNWAEVNEVVEDSFCHKSLSMMERSTRSNIIGTLLEQIDFSLTECKVGYWRETALHRTFISKFLLDIQNKLLQFSKGKKTAASYISNTGRVSVSARPFTYYTVHSMLPGLLHNRVPVKLDPLRRSYFATEPQAAEPHSNAWFQEGDIVEAAYNGNIFEWYRGRIVGASANRYTWDVIYEDEDEDLGLCYHCVRPFIPYEVGEYVETRLVAANNEMVYYPGRVVASNTNADTYDIMLESGEILESVETSEIRRAYQDDRAPVVGSRVLAMFPGETEWFPGTVIEVNSDKTFGVEYDDGDYMPYVPRSGLQLLDE